MCAYTSSFLSHLYNKYLHYYTYFVCSLATFIRLEKMYYAYTYVCMYVVYMDMM